MLLSSTTHSWHWVSVMSRASWLTMITAASKAKAVRHFALTRGVCCRGNATQIHVHPWSHSLHLPELPDLTLEVQMDACDHLSGKHIISDQMLLLSCVDTSNIFPTFPILLKRKKGNTSITGGRQVETRMVNLWRTGIRIQLQVEWDHVTTTLDWSGSAVCACTHSRRCLVHRTRIRTSSSAWTAALRCPRGAQMDSVLGNRWSLSHISDRPPGTGDTSSWTRKNPDLWSGPGSG